MRAFVAVVPPGEVLDLVEAVPRRAHADARWTRRDQWHVTLRFLGEVDDVGGVDRVVAALDAAPLAPAVARLHGPARVYGRSAVGVAVDGLEGLARGVVAGLPAGTDGGGQQSFRGHITLARVARGAGRGVVRSVVHDLAAAGLDVSFGVEAVELVRSHLGPGGARYETVHVRRL